MFAATRIVRVFQDAKILMLVAAVLSVTAARASEAGAGSVPGRLLVKPQAHVQESHLNALFKRMGAIQSGAIERINVRILELPEPSLAKVLLALQQNPMVAFVERDYRIEPDLVTNDPYFALQSHLEKVQATQAWDIARGSSNVTVAILDSGVDASHPDLAPRMVPGWNFINNNDDTHDINGHGTGVAGTVAAAGNNGIGVASVAWGCRILPVRICDTSGFGVVSAMASGLTYAADQGARVANISYRASASLTLQSAAQYFQTHGGVVTISAGNESVFDASPDNPYVLTVSATDANDMLASFSNTGNNVDLCAPGTGIVTTTAGGGYGSGTGTSFAAPIVAGVAALVFSANPSLTGVEAQDLLMHTADDRGAAEWDTSYGWGRVNAYQAVLAATNASPADTKAPLVAILSPVGGSTISNIVTVQVTATDSGGVTNVELYLDGILTGRSATGNTSFLWDTTTASNGPHTVQAKAYDVAGNAGTSSLVSATVQNSLPDTIVPVVNITSPINGTLVSRSTVVTIVASDNVGVTRVDLLVDGKPFKTSSSATPTFTWNTGKLARGNHTLQSVAYDVSGNLGRSSVVTLTK